MENELYHYGRKGMRWYQNIFTKGKEARAKRQKAAEEKRKESIEEQKTKIRNSRSAEQVYKNAHLFNDKELTEIYNRLNTENNIKNLIPAKVNKGKKFIENTASTAKNISTLVNNTTDMINKFKAFGNLFGGNKAKAAGNSGSASKPNDKNTKTDKKSKVKEAASKVFDNVEVITPKRDKSSSNSQPKPKTIIDAEWWEVSDNVNSVARAMTDNIGGRTVNWAMNNQPRLESGSSFVSGMLSLPAPKDRD